MMDRVSIQRFLDLYSDTSPTNFLQPKITAEEAAAQLAKLDVENDAFVKHNFVGEGSYDPSIYNSNKEDKYIGMRFFERPVFSACRADHPGFAKLRESGIVGHWHRMPTDWIPDAKTVISFFFPYSDRTLESNKVDPDYPSPEWLFTRMDGSGHLSSAIQGVIDMLREAGYAAVSPQLDQGYMTQHSDRTQPEDVPLFTSNWSERHVGYVAGLGTFGLHTHLISRVGCAGRLISIVTNWECEPDERDYSDYLDYCNRCGVCLRRCPPKVLHEDAPKEKRNCVLYIRKVSKNFPGRVGCGKCQSGVPCERRHF